MPSMPSGKLLLGGLAFLALTVGVFGWLFARVPGSHAAPALGDLRWGYSSSCSWPCRSRA